MQSALETLRQSFGYDNFREGQAEIIAAVLAGERTLGIMPTGGGKSITYQVPALMLPGITVVISPLISLMKNQVDELTANGIDAVTLNSTQDEVAYHHAINHLLNGQAKLLYLAPERLKSERTYALLNRLDISLVVIDEVHVLSQWGHDFRPSYLEVVHLINNFVSAPRMMALTATATKRVQNDLVERLAIDHTVRTSVVRDNLTIRLETGLKKKEKDDYITHYLQNHLTDAGIIYVPTRKLVTSLTDHLRRQHLSVVGYHAGMTDEERVQSQDDFLFDRANVVVATNAFGMGINKSNVRFVIHYSIPGSIEAYYQEIGRAGRDNLPAEAILLYAAADLQTQRFFIENSDNQTPEYQRLQKNKLQEMANYGATTVCLQQYITRYFGEETLPCGHCTNCLDEQSAVDITTDAQKVLSHVVRMRNARHNQDAFGKMVTADTLRGHVPEKFKWAHFDELTTFGLMQGVPRVRIASLIDFLLAAGYLQITGEYRGLIVSKTGLQVLQGKHRVLRRQTVQSITERVATDSPLTQDDLTDEEKVIFAKLRQWRLALSKKTEVPSFIIFNDRTLVDLARQQPTTIPALLHISGIGQAKADKYGQEVLSVISQVKKE